MSSIHFEADLDSSKLEAAIKQSNKTIKDWAKGVEKAGGQADAGLNKMTKSFKQAITEQKTLVKSIEQDVKKLQKAYDDATAGRGKMAAGGELRSVKRALAEEQAQLAKLQKQQIEGNVQIEKSSTGIIDKIGRMALAYVSVQAVVKVLKETVLSFLTRSQEGIELLERKISGLKAAVGVLQGEFIKLGKSMVGEKGDEATPWGTRLVNGLKLISTTANFIPGVRKYFDDLTTSMNEAGEAAENYTRRQQELGDAERAMIVPRAKANAEIVKARLLYADDTKKPEVRITALQKALDLENRTAQNEIKHQQWVILNIRNQNVELEKRGQLRDEDRKKLEEAIAEEINLQKESDQRQVRATNSLMAARKELYDSEKQKAKEALEAIKKEYEKIDEILSKIDPGKGYSILNRALVRKGKTPAIGSEFSKEGADNFKLASGSVEWYKKMQKDIAENDKDQIELLKEQLDLRNHIVNAAADLVYQIGEQIGLDEKSMALLNSSLDTFIAMATGNPAAIASAAGKMLAGIISYIPTAAMKFESQIEHINVLLEEQARLIELSERKGGQEQARKDELEYLRQLKVTQEKRQKELEIQIASHRTGILGGLVGSGKNKLKEVNDALEETNRLIEDAEQALTDFLTGGITENTIADVIAQGFQEGKTSVDDFADYMNQVLIDAVMSVFTDSLLSSPKMLAYMEWLKGAMTGGITNIEKEENARRIAEIADENQEAYETMTSGLNIGGEVLNQGLSMGIQRQISEQTGTELAGIWRRTSDDIRISKDYTLMGVNHLVGIEKNTAETVTQLQLAVIELKSIVSNTKQPAVGSF